jgi:bifunctional non-homologous end joining protein LigD
VREMPLIERKARLKRIIPHKPSRLLYVDHIEATGCALFKLACGFDLEGIVAKRKTWRYVASDKPITLLDYHYLKYFSKGC